MTTTTEQETRRRASARGTVLEPGAPETAAAGTAVPGAPASDLGPSGRGASASGSAASGEAASGTCQIEPSSLVKRGVVGSHGVSLGDPCPDTL
ncbi:hypothetical protein, partial [Nonomuraea sp. NPDC050405]|uniref:hypothetical protein n=1 Tax=Nonomuraea sp. NPDC050405 TaxID=3154509 RepID=UPI00340D7BEA